MRSLKQVEKDRLMAWQQFHNRSKGNQTASYYGAQALSQNNCQPKFMHPVNLHLKNKGTNIFFRYEQNWIQETSPKGNGHELLWKLSNWFSLSSLLECGIRPTHLKTFNQITSCSKLPHEFLEPTMTRSPFLSPALKAFFSLCRVTLRHSLPLAIWFLDLPAVTGARWPTCPSVRFSTCKVRPIGTACWDGLRLPWGGAVSSAWHSLPITGSCP